MTVYVITGPPAGGKSTWVREHATPGDITIDYDDLAAVLAPGVERDPAAQPAHIASVVTAARNAAINEAVTEPTAHDVYIIHAMPSRQAMNRYRKHGMRIVTIDPGYNECMTRAVERTPRQQAIIQDWYARRGLTV